MASVTSLMNNNYNTNSTSSIYGSRNVLTGLASGMDTETMIENAVSGIKRKLQSLYQKRTKIEWQQEAYRSIIDKAVNLNTKYTSYSSKTNLLSSSFFTNAVITSVNGTYADKLTATGKSSSEIKINAVKQMATAASYTVSGMGGLSSADLSSITGGNFNVAGLMTQSTVSGNLTFQYGGSNGTTFDISFDELEDLTEGMEGKSSAEQLAAAIKKKLSEVTYSYTKNGVQETTTADKAINVSVENGEIKFSDGLGNGNKITISGGSGSIIKTLGISQDDTSIKVGSGTKLAKEVNTVDYLSGKTLSLNFNGTTKTISMSKVIRNANFSNSDDYTVKNQKFKESLQAEIDEAFGKGKIEVSYDSDGRNLSFTTKGEGDTLNLGGTAIRALGFENGDSNYINTSKKLSEILGDKAGSIFTAANRMAAEGYVLQKTTSSGTYYVDSKGNKVEKADDGKYYQIDDTGKAVYDFEVNGSHIKVTEDTTLESLIGSINSNADAGVQVSYSKLTNEFKFTATETGSNSKIEFGGLASALFNPPSGIKSTDNFADAYGIDLGENNSKQVTFYSPDGNSIEFTVTDEMSINDILDNVSGFLFQPSASDYTASYDEQTGKFIATHNETGETFDIRITSENEDGELITHTAPSFSSFTAGTDAIMDVEINGARFENLTRSSNSFDIDGMTINVKGTFGVDEDGNLLTEDKDGNEIEPITFTTVTDSDKIIDAIREFVNDYNEMVTELKNAYSVQPNYNSSNSRYEPLTAEDEEGMTESEIAASNDKAKQGILFGDTTLSSFYSKLLNAIAPGGADGQILREIGISSSYENGLTTLSLDEDKLRTTLDNNPDKVQDAFTKTTESGASSNGIMQNLQNALNTYVKTTGEPKGVLITRAGSVKAPTSLSNNSLNTQISSIDKQIERWQNKMSSQIDRYTAQFSRLEQLIAAMDSQSAALANLMGGYSGY